VNVAVTEREVHRGMLQAHDAANSSFCITRCITNLTDHIEHQRAHKFIDIATDSPRPDGVTVDVTAQQMLTSLRRDKIGAVLDPDSVSHFDIHWDNPSERNPNEDAAYLSEFMDVFETKMLALIERAVGLQCSVSCNAHVVEILQHLTVCRQRSQVGHRHTQARYSSVVYATGMCRLLSKHADRQGVDISVTVFCFYVCTVEDFFAEDKASGVKFCTVVHRHPRQGISHFGELSSPRSPKSADA